MRWWLLETMTQPCVCELTVGGKTADGAPATVRVDRPRRAQDRASSELTHKGAPGPPRSVATPRWVGWPSHLPHRSASPAHAGKTNQQFEHTRTSNQCLSSNVLRLKVLTKLAADTQEEEGYWRSFGFAQDDSFFGTRFALLPLSTINSFASPSPRP